MSLPRRSAGPPLIAGEHDGEQDKRIELDGGQQSKLSQYRRRHLLAFVNEEYRPCKRTVDVGLPSLTQNLRSRMSVVRAQRRAEQVTKLPEEV
jgi:hypothetical protein